MKQEQSSSRSDPSSKNQATARIAIFASGTGSNAVNIIKHFSGSKDIIVELVLSNKVNAPVVKSAAELGIEVITFARSGFRNGEVLSMLKEREINWIILAGFLWLMPADIVTKWSGRILNIHPALLPRHGGKGMFGRAVHQAVLDSGDKETGITIHYVNNEYDKGEMVAQFSCKVSESDSVETIERHVRELEQIHFPGVIEQCVTQWRRQSNQYG